MTAIEKLREIRNAPDNEPQHAYIDNLLIDAILELNKRLENARVEQTANFGYYRQLYLCLADDIKKLESQMEGK